MDWCLYSPFLLYYSTQSIHTHVHTSAFFTSNAFNLTFTHSHSDIRGNLISSLAKDALKCILVEPGIEPLTFWLVGDALYLLSDTWDPKINSITDSTISTARTAHCVGCNCLQSGFGESKLPFVCYQFGSSWILHAISLIINCGNCCILINSP